MDPVIESLHALAEAHGVQLSYYDVTGKLCQASPEALVRILQTLGAPIAGPEQAADALRARRQNEARRPIEPVILAWDAKHPDLTLRLPATATGSFACRLALENGEPMNWSCPLECLPVVNQAEVEGITFTTRRLTLPGNLPLGYHHLEMEAAGQLVKSMILAAPERAYQPPSQAGGSWGVFAPLYAIHSQRSWGSGDFGDLEQLADWTKSLGGGMVATLPLLAAFLDEPFEPGPYSPASRLFWNEFYLDIERIPELAGCPKAKAILSSEAFLKERNELRAEKRRLPAPHETQTQGARRVGPRLFWNALTPADGFSTLRRPEPAPAGLRPFSCRLRSSSRIVDEMARRCAAASFKPETMTRLDLATTNTFSG